MTDDDNVRYMVSAGGIVHPARVNGVLRYPTTGAGADLERGEPQELDESEEEAENDEVSDPDGGWAGSTNIDEESDVSSLDDDDGAANRQALEGDVGAGR